MAPKSAIPTPPLDSQSSTTATPDLERTLPISEIFYSIQGESTHVGRPSVFVRVAGCPLRCVWCDTEYALDFKAGPRQTVSDILREVAAKAGGWPDAGGVPLITLTGGEPLAHVGIITLAEHLLARRCEVLVFTSGAFAIDKLPLGCKRIMDIKCPDSGEATSFLPANLAALKPGDEVKFVCASRRDFEFAMEFIRSNQLPATLPVLLSPAVPLVSAETLASWLLEKRPCPPNIRLHVQVHKVVWPTRDRGY